MGKTLINNKPVVTPASQERVSVLKELGDVPAHEKLYRKEDGRILEDDEVVPTDHAAYGVITDVERG